MLKFDNLRFIANQNGFQFDRTRTGYELWSNDLAPGVEGVYNTLEEAWQDIYQLKIGNNPLTGNKLG